MKKSPRKSHVSKIPPGRGFEENRFKKSVFENGLTLLTESLPEFKSLSIGVWVKSGTRHELPGEAGVSHFLEHMLFKGTQKRSALDIAREVDRVGGEFNAFTAREFTCFHILLLHKDLDLGIEILSDILLNSEFNSEEFEREKRVILQEISMVEESPEEFANDVFFELIYGNHRLGLPILGTETSIRKMTRRDLVSYFRAHYRPDNLIVSVAGDTTHQNVRKKLGPLLKAKWPSRSVPRSSQRKNFSESAPVVNSGSWWVERPSEQVHILWGVEGPRYEYKDRFAAFLLNVYLGGGMSSALFQEIREKNALAYTVYSTLTPFIDSGIFSVYSATGMAQVPLCLRLIEEGVEKLRTKLLTADELRIVKDNLKGTIFLSSDSVESRMSSIAKNEIYFKRYYSVKEVCSMIDRVGPEDVRRVANQLLGAGKRSILALGPKPTKTVKSKLQLVFPKKFQ